MVEPALLKRWLSCSFFLLSFLLFFSFLVAFSIPRPASPTFIFFFRDDPLENAESVDCSVMMTTILT